MSRLEADLGVKLFERRRGKITLTDDGRLFLNHVQTALNEISTAVETLHSGAQERSDSDHPLAKKKYIKTSELAGEKFICDHSRDDEAFLQRMPLPAYWMAVFIRHASVIHQNIQMAELPHGLVHHTLAVLPHADIRTHGNGLSAKRADLIQRGRQLLFLARDQHDRRAILREKLRRFRAYAGAAPP